MEIGSNQDLMRQALQEARVIAVVGLSDNPSRPSHGVAKYLQEHGYKIVPVTPKCEQVLGEQAYPDLLSVPFDVDMVNIFRRPAAVGPHVDEAIQKGVKTIWMQLGIRDEEAAKRARDAGIQVVMDRCTKIEHMRLIEG
jgi:predicted CoA-binding protein